MSLLPAGALKPQPADCLSLALAMTLPRSALHRALGALLLAGGLSCVDGPTAPRPVALVTATPEAISLRPLDTTTLVARVTALDGTEIVGRPMEWRALDTTIANVTAEGLVTARAYTGPAIRNTAIVVTTLGASTDTVPVEVLPWAVERVIAGPAELTLSPRDSAQLTLRLESAGGLELSGRTIAWIADDTNVVQVNAAGRARARLYTGPLTRLSWIIAFSEEKADSVRVTVPPLEVASITVSPTTTSLTPGQLDTLSAVVRTADGQALTETPLTWSSTDTTIARVNEEGVVTATFYAGFETRVASVIARFGSVADTTAVEIRPLAVSRLQFFVDTITLRPGTTYRPTATLSDAAGASLADRPITWSALDALVAQVSDSGTIATQPYNGPLTRTARITAASAGVADTFLVTVTPHVVTFVVVNPERLTMQPLDSAQLTPHFESLFGDTLFNRPIAYTSQNNSVAGVSPDGKVFAAAYTGDSVRTTIILATSGTAVDTIPVEVLPLPVQSVVVSPSAVTLPPRGMDTLSVTTLSPAGLPLTGRGAVWVSGDTSAVHVSADGVITARPYFGPLARTVEIVVFSSGLADTATVTVQPEVATELQLSVGSITMSPGAVDTLRAALRTSTSDSLTDFPLQWRSTDSTVAIVNAEGIVTARFYTGEAARTSSVIVSLGALADTAVIVVAPLAVSSVEIKQTNESPNSEREFALFTFLRDATGLLLSGREVNWTVSDTSVATIRAQGEGAFAVGRLYVGPDTRSVTVTAASEGVSDSLTLSWPPLSPVLVNATPEALTLAPLDTATVAVNALGIINRLGQLTELTGRTKAFTSLDTTVAVVDGTGRVTARAYAGPAVRFASIVASVEGVTDTVPLTVVPLAIDRVVASPSAVTIPVGDSVSLSATSASADGTTLTGREFVWLSSDTSIVRVSDAGVATARPYDGPLERTAFAIVFSGGRADSVTVTVTPRSASSLEVTPASVSLLPGGVTTLGTAVRTAGGELLSDFPLTWTSTDTAVARVNVAGVVTAQFYVGAATRNALVIVSTGTLADTSSIEVLPLAVASVAVTPESGTLLPGGTFQLDAALRDAEGLLLVDRITTWTSLAPAIAAVDANGLVSAAVYGGTLTRTVAIVATSASAADTVTLTLPPLDAAWLTATPEALNLLPLDTTTITARVESLNLTELTGRVISFASVDPAIATVDAAGIVTATAYAGAAVRSTAIVLTSGAAVDTVPVTVTPLAIARVVSTPSTITLAVGGSTTLTAVTESANGTPLSGRDFVWISSDTSVAQVSDVGVVQTRPYTGPLERTVLIVVFSAGVADTTAVTVTPLTAGSVEVTPATASLLPGGVTTLAAAVRTAGGVLLSDFPLSWSSTNATVAGVNAEGIVTAQFYVGAATRSAMIIVSTGALADTTSIDVLPLAVDSVAIAPNEGTLVPSATFLLDVALRDAEGLLLEGRVTTWTSLDPTVATVNGSGLVTAAAFGGTATRTARIVASSGGVADTVTLTVAPHTVAAVTATPEALSLLPLDTATITPTVTALDLTVLNDRAVTWASLDVAIAGVDANGLVTATAYTGPAVRSTAIVATSAMATDTIPITVTPFAVERVIAAPSTVTLSPDDTTTLTVSLESQDGTVLTGRDRLWLSSDTSIVTLDSLTGLVTARPYAGANERTVDVVVYSEGKADTVAVTVNALAAVSVTIAPDTVSIFPGELTTLAATLRSASDTVLVDRPITWTSANPAIATVNADGVVLGLFYVGPDERSVEMIATRGVLADTALVRVRALLVDSIAIFPDTQTIQAAQTAQLAVVLRDSAGLFLDGRTVTWTSSDPTRATVSSTGLVSALVAGTVTITATSGGVSDQATITIAPVVTNVRVTPELSTVWIGRTLPLTVALRDSNGVEPTGRTVTWTSSNPAVATVSELGIVTALSTGEVSITATSEGRADTVSLDIFPEPAAAVTITFDDSWRGVLELAYPVMQELRLRANVGWITSVNWAGVMNPTELRVLQDGGWSIVSHSMTHPFLTQIPLDSARFELEGSRARIDSLGFDPRVFIAPYLDHNDAVLLESAAAGYTYSRCCAEDVWSTDTLVSWPIQPAARHRLAGVDVTNYDGQISSYNFRTADGRSRLRNLLLQVVAEGKFLDVFFHDVLPEDVPDLRLTMEILAEFRPYLITYAMLP